MATLTDRRLITPPVNTQGFYSLYQPFTTNAELTYTCDAIRSFTELTKRNIDVYNTYYKPLNISEEDFGKDVDLKASIVTLISSKGEFLYVPNTYIESYPGMEGIEYQRTVLILELGPLPATVDINYLLPQLKDLAAKAAGTTADIAVARVPLESTVTHEEHQRLTAARRGAMASLQSQAVEISKLTERNDALTRQVDELMAIIASRPEFVS